MRLKIQREHKDLQSSRANPRSTAQPCLRLWHSPCGLLQTPFTPLLYLDAYNMARLNTRRSTTDTIYRDRTPEGASGTTPSPTPPSASFSSDKENRNSSRASPANKRPLGNAKSTMNGSGKRRRLEEQPRNAQRRRTTASTQQQELEEDDDKNFYDPDQDPEERRNVRMQLRNNNRELKGTSSMHET